MKIYLTDLEAYNNGHLVGKWIKLPEEDLEQKLNEILENGKKICKDNHNHEEYFITDYECEYLRIGEYDAIHRLNYIANKMKDFSNEEKEKIDYLVYEGYSIDDAIEYDLDEIIMYENMTINELANQFIEDGMLGVVSEDIKNYLDYEKVANDLCNKYTSYNGNIYYIS